MDYETGNGALEQCACHVTSALGIGRSDKHFQHLCYKQRKVFVHYVRESCFGILTHLIVYSMSPISPTTKDYPEMQIGLTEKRSPFSLFQIKPYSSDKQ